MDNTSYTTEADDGAVQHWALDPIKERAKLVHVVFAACRYEYNRLGILYTRTDRQACWVNLNRSLACLETFTVLIGTKQDRGVTKKAMASRYTWYTILLWPCHAVSTYLNIDDSFCETIPWIIGRISDEKLALAVPYVQLARQSKTIERRQKGW